ncbi:MAG TPA: hypothetical protein VFQ60_04305 [Patescibacteria group bacterium]|nr:hypothetical protein [Patescibacteria group bacterium]
MKKLTWVLWVGVWLILGCGNETAQQPNKMPSNTCNTNATKEETCISTLNAYTHPCADHVDDDTWQIGGIGQVYLHAESDMQWNFVVKFPDIVTKRFGLDRNDWNAVDLTKTDVTKLCDHCTPDTEALLVHNTRDVNAHSWGTASIHPAQTPIFGATGGQTGGGGDDTSCQIMFIQIFPPSPNDEPNTFIATYQFPGAPYTGGP